MVYYGRTEPVKIKSPSKTSSVRDTGAWFLAPTIDVGAIAVARWIARSKIPPKWQNHAATIQNCIAKWAAKKDPELNLTSAISSEMARMFDNQVLHQAVMASDSEKQRQARDIVIYSKVRRVLCVPQYIS